MKRRAPSSNLVISSSISGSRGLERSSRTSIAIPEEVTRVSAKIPAKRSGINPIEFVDKAVRWSEQPSVASDAMRMSRLFARTLRDDPADADIDSHRLLVRGAYIRKVASGIYSWLPLGQRVLRKV